MKIPRASLSIALTLASSLASSVAFADEPSAAQHAEAVKRFNEGIASSARGDYEAARLRFIEALTVFPERPSLLWNLGVAEMKTHHPAAAIQHLRAYLRSPAATNADRAKAHVFLDEAAGETGHVILMVDPGAVVRVDDGAFGDAPADPLDVEPGPHVLEARVGPRAKTASVSPQAGQTVTADLRLPEPPAETTAPAAVSPPSATPVPAPAATASGSTSYPSPSPGPKPSSSTTRIVVASALGAAAVGAIVTGAVFLANASSDGARGAAAAASPPPGGCALPANAASCSAGHQAAENEAQDKDVATGMFVIGGVLAGGAVASWFLLAPKSDRTTGAVLAPMVSPTAAGCVLSGRF